MIVKRSSQTGPKKLFIIEDFHQELLKRLDTLCPACGSEEERGEAARRKM